MFVYMSARLRDDGVVICLHAMAGVDNVSRVYSYMIIAAVMIYEF